MHRIAALFFAALFAALPAAAQDAYPGKPITLVVPYAPGGGSDFLGRVLAEGLHTRLNQTVIVQNIPGAGSVVGSQQVAKAKPDGYTLLLNHVGLSTVPALYKKLNFDPLASYEFIGLFAEAPMMIMARKEFGPKTYAELVAYAKEKKDKFTMASSGMGSSTHLCAMIFQEALGVPITVVQYKGAGPAVIDVRSGQVDAICDLPTTTSAQIRNGDLRAYLLTAPERMKSLPDVPTANELGVPSLAIGVWFGVYAPLGTPQPVIATLNKALREIVQDRAVAEKLASIETFLLPLDQATPEALKAKLASQIALWTPLIEKAGIQAE
ncbi:MAG: tripartite tricarboxylate transporter substrate binding protein BugD [Reyranella sp.]|uniref:Bug family tripartite tricarboxylate transporter substrate binding protein n=1 Tax=Reyranella sp. TaxID=1929291 RepID=UPI001AD55E97|nr:tripartite tricarboxylate transporter substrate-binding protein [Reyranella sp.]MBN9088328.1 tripartite tricarboxylate transporter substrate binding protein BugD [Reyranella sp.]